MKFKDLEVEATFKFVRSYFGSCVKTGEDTYMECEECRNYRVKSHDTDVILLSTDY